MRDGDRKGSLDRCDSFLIRKLDLFIPILYILI